MSSLAGAGGQNYATLNMLAIDYPSGETFEPA
jgi:hypothetical protein